MVNRIDYYFCGDCGGSNIKVDPDLAPQTQVCGLCAQEKTYTEWLSSCRLGLCAQRDLTAR